MFRKLALATIAILALISTAQAGDTIRKDVCIGGLEHYGHGSLHHMWIFHRHDKDVDCEFEDNTPEGRTVMRACGKIEYSETQDCRIEGTFRVLNEKVRLELLHTDRARIVPSQVN